MYYTHPGCRTSIFGENRAYCIQDFTVLISLTTDEQTNTTNTAVALPVQWTVHL